MKVLQSPVLVALRRLEFSTTDSSHRHTTEHINTRDAEGRCPHQNAASAQNTKFEREENSLPIVFPILNLSNSEK